MTVVARLHGDELRPRAGIEPAVGEVLPIGPIDRAVRELFSIGE